jgi:hypothetical protein
MELKSRAPMSNIYSIFNFFNITTPVSNINSLPIIVDSTNLILRKSSTFKFPSERILHIVYTSSSCMKWLCVCFCDGCGEIFDTSITPINCDISELRSIMKVIPKRVWHITMSFIRRFSHVWRLVFASIPRFNKFDVSRKLYF